MYAEGYYGSVIVTPPRPRQLRPQTLYRLRDNLQNENLLSTVFPCRIFLVVSNLVFCLLYWKSVYCVWCFFASFRELQEERVLCMLFFSSFRELQEERVLCMLFFFLL